MRVLTVGSMYPPEHLGGYELIWQSAVRALRDRGHEVRVLASDFALPNGGPRPEEDPDVHRELRRYWEGDRYPALSPRERLRIERANARTLRRHLDDFRPDAVSWWSMGGLSLSLLERVRRAGVPAVAYVADGWLVDGPKLDGWLRAWDTRPRTAALAARLTGIPTRLDPGAGARWLFISDATRAEARERWVLPDTAVAHAGVDDVFTAQPRRPWHWRLLYAGRVDGVKGVDTAIEALALLPEAATLTIAGPDGAPEDVAAFTALAERLGVAGRIKRRPALGRAELAGAYAQADALLFPVRWAEPWGLVPLEAMAVGTPVIASGTGGSAEYLANGANSLVVPGGDPRDWAAAVIRLAAEPRLRERLREGGLRTASRHPADMAPLAVARALEDAAGHPTPTIEEAARC
jgi:glycogen synthase